MAAPAVDALRRLLRTQVDELRTVPLRALSTPEAAAQLAFDDDGLGTLIVHRERLVPHLSAGSPELGRLIEDAATRFGRQLRERSQYVSWHDAAKGQLEQLFGAYYRRLGAQLATTGGVEDLRLELVPVLEGHLGRLSRFVLSLWREGAVEAEQAALADTISNEYSVGLQLDVLALEPASMLGPVVDLGCGSSALLVHHLRNLGLEAWGLERNPTEAAHVQVGDWLETDFGEGRWGTVIAHLSFTNHFVLHHGASAETASEYAQAYLRVLRSLIVGGSFHYAPGVPFIEALLSPEDYRVTRREVLLGPDDSAIDAVQVLRLR